MRRLRPSWAVVFLAVAGGFVVGALVSGHVASLSVEGWDWGSVPDWIGGVGTATAVSVAAVELTAERRQRARDEAAARRLMAQAVVVSDVALVRAEGGYAVTVTVENGGTHPVFECQVDVGVPEGSVTNVRLGTVGGGKSRTSQSVTQGAPGPPGVQADWRLRFRDSWGALWASDNGELQPFRGSQPAEG